MTARRVLVTPTLGAFRVVGGPTYAYRVGDAAGRAKARRRAVRWLAAHPPVARGDALPAPDRRLSAPGGPERTYRARIKRNQTDPIRAAIVRHVGPVIREMAAAQAAEKRDKAKRGDASEWTVRLLTALGLARVDTRAKPVPVGDVGAETARHATEGARAQARRIDDPVLRASVLRRIDLGATEAQRAALTAWARENANLVSSIVPDAYDRLAKVIAENVREGTQARTVAKMLERQFQVDANRAQLIARTEIAKLNATVGQDAMKRSGSTGYVWRTVEDERVRELHAELDGQAFEWSDPPVIGTNGERGHPGSIYNCRCVSEPHWSEPDEAALDAEIAARFA